MDQVAEVRRKVREAVNVIALQRQAVERLHAEGLPAEGAEALLLEATSRRNHHLDHLARLEMDLLFAGNIQSQHHVS
jgi:hypothetical protein